MSNDFTEYNLPQTAYTTFDAESLKSLIIERLNENSTFTDQIYEGSNLSSFIDIIAYSYHVLLFYLNRTSSESVFSQATIYENINRIVKLLNYKPLGYQTSSLTFKTFATEDLVPGNYTIPRYSYINSNGISYTTDRDITFTKNTQLDEPLSIIGSTYLLYQGQWVENQPVEAVGSTFETVIITTPPGTMIDHFHVDVYVKDLQTQKYIQYNETNSLFLHSSADPVFEKRLNEDMSYEIKFGNGVTGKRLNQGDVIQIYYLQSDGEKGVVGPNFLDENRLNIYGTNTFSRIKNDIRPQNIKYITYDNLETLYMTNDSTSTPPQQRESVDEIKKKAPVYYTSRDRLVTLSDYNIFVEKNYGRLVTSSEVVDNDKYLDGHFRYMIEEIGVNNPNTESRVMFNHLDIASTNTFNNIYMYCVPYIAQNTSIEPMTNFLSNSQKNVILNTLDKVKMVSHQPIIMDPVYMAVNLATRSSGESESYEFIENTVLEIKRSTGVIRDDDALIEEVSKTIVNYFENTNVVLGQDINTTNLSTQLLEIQGVDELVTVREDTGQRTPGLSLCIWNPVYPQDITITTQNTKLPYYKYPYFHDAFDLYKKIRVVS